MERQGRIELLVICLEGSGSTIELQTHGVCYCLLDNKKGKKWTLYLRR